MKKSIPLCAMLLTVLVSLPLCVLANPSTVDPDIPQTPNKTSPTITLDAPINNQSFDVGTEIPYVLTITVPPDWFVNQQGKCYNSILGIGYVLSYNQCISLAGERIDQPDQYVWKDDKFVDVPSFSIQNPNITLSGKLPELPVGHQAIIAAVSWSSDYHIPKENFQGSPIIREYRNVTYSNVINFNVNNQSAQNGNPAFPTSLLLGTFVGFTALGAALIVFWRKHKGKK
ncbi:MAG: hypothetical protein NWE92_13190 [Candidatus Bathyarchaeota archaeon]|nr:hypothetical protein [Candidatus Bathyarchaeota archaeon]